MKILRLVNEVFSSPKLLSVCFGSEEKCSSAMQVEGNDNSQLESIELNLDEVRQVYSLILSCGHEGVVNSLSHAFWTLTSDMQIHSKTYNASPLFLKLYFIVLLHPNILETEFLPTLKPLFEAFSNVPRETRELIIRFVESWTTEYFLIFLRIFRQIISVRIARGSVKEARLGVKCLDMLHVAYLNTTRFSVAIPQSEFCIQEVSDYVSVLEARKREYQMWLRDLGTTNTASYSAPRDGVDRHSFESFISFPYILTAGVKASIIELDANVQMRQVRFSSLCLGPSSVPGHAPGIRGGPG